MTVQEKLNEFTWDDFQIRDINGDWILFLLTTKERAEFIYGIISKVELRLGVIIDDKTKIYTIVLLFKYNKEKAIEFSHNTNCTSEEYSPLLLLNNGAVKFITTGVRHPQNTSIVSFHQPFLNLDCFVHPN